MIWKCVLGVEIREDEGNILELFKWKEVERTFPPLTPPKAP